MFEHKKVLILGCARSGLAAALFLIKRGNEVIVNDFANIDKLDKEKIDYLKSLGVTFVLGGHPDDLLDGSFDYLIKNPGIAIDHKYVLKAHELGVSVINELEMAYQCLRSKDITLIGITGTNGKTTTTTLIYEMIKASGKKVHLAGNIGYPLCDFVDVVEDGDILVVETSCQQLENVVTYKPDIAVVTNIDIAHLEFMKTFEHYKYVKSKLFLNQTENDILILNKEDQELNLLADNAKANKKYFSSLTNDCDCYIEDKAIYFEDKKVIDLDDIKLIGKHNYENIMAAILACLQVGVQFSSICKVLKEFKGVTHRLEYVNTVNGVTYYNDTEATNIKCTKIALSSFVKPIILILGGYERNQDFNELKDYVSNVKEIYAIGSCRNRVLDFGNNVNIKTYVFEYLKDAMGEIVKNAQSGDVVLLSPASASWDQYKQCEDRGDEFKNIVNNL